MERTLDTGWRSLAKSLTWRIAAIIILGGLSWLFTRGWRETALITITFNAIQFILYYFHERAWEKIGWGRRKIKEDYMI
jgi:uncharacterized membrane protein